jgi:hypothetical protein
MVRPIELSTFRPLVRYVDDERAVLDAQLTLTADTTRWLAQRQLPTHLVLQIHGGEGFFDETTLTLPPGQRTIVHRFEIVQPRRWWPAGMGAQPLYTLTVDAYVRDTHHLEKQVHFGLTSIRATSKPIDSNQPTLLVNGQPIELHSIVTVDRVDENQLLPATGDSLLLVTDHYGPELLYQAADQAGILLIQCVPVDAEAHPERSVGQQIDRLTPHPSLAGYFVGHLGRLRDQLAHHLRQLDPTRTVFRNFPDQPAA